MTGGVPVSPSRPATPADHGWVGAPARPAAPAAARGAGGPAVFLVLVAALLVVPAVSLAWARSTLRDGAGWQDRLGPLHEDVDLARSLADGLADRYADGRDPADRAAFEATATAIITSPTFGAEWRRVVGQVHDQALGMVDGERTGDVALDLTAVVDELEARGAIEPGSQDRLRSVTVVDAEHADAARDAGTLLDRLVLVVPLVALVVAALGLLVARNRLRAGRLLGITVAILAGVSALITLVLPGAVVDALATEAVRAAVRDVVDAFTGGLVLALAVTAGLGVVVAVGCALGERSRRPVAG